MDNENKKLILTGIAIGAGVGLVLVLLLFPWEDRQGKDSNELVLPRTETPAVPTEANESSTLSAIKVSGPAAPASKKVLSKKEELILQDWKKIVSLARAQDQECRERMPQFLKDPDWVDLRSHLYQDKGQVLSTVGLVVGVVAGREIKGSFEALETLLESGVDYDYGELYAEINQLDSCRQREYLNLIDSGMEAARIYKWNEKERRELIRNILLPLLSSVGQDALIFDVIFVIGILKKLMAQGLVDQQYKDELDGILNQALEDKSQLEEILRGSGPAREKRRLLRQFYWSGKELGPQVQQLMDEIL
jgi:hypothetical protein